MPDPKTFIKWSNNSLRAVMLLEDYERMLADPESDDVGPIFLFYPDGYVDLPERGREPWITGDLSLMQRLLAGHIVVEREIGVPFSNGHELYDTLKTLLSQFRKCPSVQEAIEIFGLEVARDPALA
jgi:hypothetical protein